MRRARERRALQGGGCPVVGGLRRRSLARRRDSLRAISDGDEVRVEQLDELGLVSGVPRKTNVTYLLIQHAHFHARIAPVLLEDGGERPPLQLAPAADYCPRPMPAHVAAHEGRERVRLQQQRKGADDQRLSRRW